MLKTRCIKLCFLSIRALQRMLSEAKHQVAFRLQYIVN